MSMVDDPRDLSPDELTPEDRKFERLLERFDDGTALEALEADALDGEELIALEILAALPQALTPETPDPKTRAAVLAAVAPTAADAPNTEAAPNAEAEVLPFRRSKPTESAPTVRGRGERRVALLAASLMITVVGAGWLGFQVRDQDSRIAELQAENQTLEQRIVEQQEFHGHKIQTTAGVADSAIPLYRVGILPTSAEPPSEAVVFMCRPHDHWYLNIRNLDPAPSEKSYHLWFLTEDGAIHAGLVDPSHSAQTVHDHLPKDLRGVLVTLETTETPEQPGEHQVLRGEQTIML